MKQLRWTILHEDEDVIAIDKPAMLLSIPDRYDSSIANLKSTLEYKRGEIFVLHRMDKETSGVILYAKNKSSYQNLSDQMESEKVDKIYQAITHNTPAEEIGQIDLPIAASKNIKKGMTINPDGKTAATKYRILSRYDNYTHVEIKLITDRIHQIRVHMSAIRCPLICDKIYGDGDSFFLSQIKRKYRRSDKVERPLLSRTALHCSQITYTSPSTGETMTMEAPLPKDMKAVLHQLEKHNSRG